MVRIGIIGAGNIALRHLEACRIMDDVSVAAICDLNQTLAQSRATEYGIAHIFSDHRELLADPQIDAVSIVTPTFTHGSLVAEALRAGKHVLCEKPPALTYEEALANEQLAKEQGKLLMYGFVCRFHPMYAWLKDYIDAGKVGEIYYAEAYRMQRCSQIGGWFRDKEKCGGGQMMDAAIHQLDILLYYMGYPKVKSVRGYASYVNKDLPDRIQNVSGGYVSVDNQRIPRTVESFASAYITFEGGKNLFIKAAQVANTLNPGTQMELLGDRGGICFNSDGIRLLTVEDNQFVETKADIPDGPNHFTQEIRHFVDCCQGKAVCLAPAHHGTEIMRILNSIYKSAETGNEIVISE
ncbi:MAG: Gfo/Idh/MocA family oxidoreductase [Oscillospiraceae bacterium]|nr:Gfo/Idh/MocA family oxidoreductase [Oscillospiraceae bacterium]